MIPRATYRIQFHRHFTFDDAAALAPYLAALGISHVYASPILAARPGSPHGYDVIDHARLNEELGGEEAFRRLCAELAAHDLKLVVDIVPNHMAAHEENAWWLDVLEKGEASAFARYFDIDWHPGDPLLEGKVLLPFLGESYVEALGRLSLGFDEGLNRFVFRYFDHKFPLRIEDYRAFGEHWHSSPARLEEINAPDALYHLLERQHFRLCWWRTAADAINWRRFFNINDLIALRVEEPEVFEAVHGKIFSLVAEGLIDGLRVDHIDGLADPAGYCRKLRARLDSAAPSGTRPWLVVEKILGVGESLPADWPVDGTTGYDFLNDVCALLHDPHGQPSLSDSWRAISGCPDEFLQEARAARREVATKQFAAPLVACARAFGLVAKGSARAVDLPENAIVRALVRLIVELRTYRTYATGLGAFKAPQLEAALAAAKAGATETDQFVLCFIENVFEGEEAATGSAAGDAVRRFNQLASAVAAKAVEDTAFYRYGRLLSRNDVGCAPEQFSLSAGEFHERTIRRAQDFPHGLLATATHDHKRGEDSRARLAVLSELAEEWDNEVRCWFQINNPFRDPCLNLGDEYQLYQSLVGSWPTALGPGDREGLARFAERIAQWRVKSLREAKLRSSWSEPDIRYESESVEFIHALLDPNRSREFLSRLRAFVDLISPAAALNSLVQTALRCTLPGVPDLYQGAELWDFSLVDPDNRRPVDFCGRKSSLADGGTAQSFLAHWRDGRFKQHTIQTLLSVRRDWRSLFEQGRYVPLAPSGLSANRLLAFARVEKGRAALVAVPLHCARECSRSGAPLPAPEFWNDTEIECRHALGVWTWRSLFEQQREFAGTHLRCSELFARYPIAVLTGH